MKSVPVRHVIVALAVLCFAFAPAPLSAQEQKADIVIYVIEASKEGKGVDPQIQDLVKELRETLQFSSYKLISKIPTTLSTGDKKVFSLPEKRKMALEMKGIEGRYIKITAKITKTGKDGRDIINTDYRTTEDHPLMITLPADHDTNRLFIAVIATW